MTWEQLLLRLSSNGWKESGAWDHLHLPSPQPFWWALCIDSVAPAEMLFSELRASLHLLQSLHSAICYYRKSDQEQPFPSQSGYQWGLQQTPNITKLTTFNVPGNDIWVTEKEKFCVYHNYLIKRPQKSGVRVLVEVPSSEVGQAVDQEQSETSHRCQTFSPNKQSVLRALCGKDAPSTDMSTLWAFSHFSVHLK